MEDTRENSTRRHATATLTRVLVAESDQQLRRVLSWVLNEDERFVVVGQVPDGDTAVAFEEPYDLALVDLSISGLGGLGTIARLVQRESAPVVVVLADSDSVYLRHAAAAEGAVGFLVKSADLYQLGDRLLGVLEGSGPHPPGRRPLG